MAVEINKDTVVKAIKTTAGFLGRQLDFVFLGLMAATSLGVIVFYVSEASTPVPAVDEPKPVVIEIKISAEKDHPKSEVYFSVFNLIDPVEPLDQTEYQNLIDFNMFDPRAARDAEQLHDEAKQKLMEAESRFDQGNYEDARRLAQEALSQAPMMQAAVRLLDKIRAQTEAAEAEAEDAEGEEGSEEDADPE
jgi:predicted S18 family serine protease